MLQSSKHTVNAVYAKVTETKHLRESDMFDDPANSYQHR